MNLDYERNVCFTEATNSGLFTKKKLKRKKYHFIWILKRFMASQNVSRDLISKLVSRCANVFQNSGTI